MSKNEKAALAAAVLLGSYWAMKQPWCNEACKAFFGPLESDAGKMLASVTLAMIVHNG